LIWVINFVLEFILVFVTEYEEPLTYLIY